MDATMDEACEAFLAAIGQDYDDEMSELLQYLWRAGATWMLIQTAKHPERLVGFYDEIKADLARMKAAKAASGD